MKYKKFNPYKNNRRMFADLTLTIGCNIDGKPALKPEGVWFTAHKHITQRLDSYTTSLGEWEGIPETSVNIRVSLVPSFQLPKLLRQVERLADALEQDAIGVWDSFGGSTLVYGSKWHAKQNTQKNA